MKPLGVDRASGVLDPKEAILMAVSCDAFAYGQQDTNNDRITIEWNNTPDGAAKTFRREWFQGDDVSAESIGVAIAAPPREGAANQCLLDFVKDTLKLRNSEISFDKGAKSRDKVLLISTDRMSIEDVNNSLKVASNS